MSAIVRQPVNIPEVKKVFTGIQPFLLQVCCAGISALAAFAPVFGNMRPLAISFAAAVPSPYSFMALAGAAIGHALSLSMDAAAPYLVTVVVLAVFKTFFSALRKASNALPVFSLIASSSFFVIAMGMSVAMGESITAMLAVFSQSLVIFGASILLRRGFTTPWYSVNQLSAHARASILFVIITALVLVSPYSVYGVELIHIFGAFIVLFACISGREYSGALTAIAVCTAFFVANPTSLYAGFAISFAGLIAGVFLRDSRFLTCLIFFLSGLIGISAAGDITTGIIFMAELFIACVMIMLVPSRLFAKVNISGTTSLGRATITTLSGRLDMVSGALMAVGTTLNAVCERLPGQIKTYGDVCDTVTSAVCRNCDKCEVCWSEGNGNVYDAFNNMQYVLQSRGYVTPADLPEPLLSTCKLPKRLTSGLSTVYRTSVQQRTQSLASKTMRAALTEQYNAMAVAIAGLSNQVYREEMPDKRKEKRLERLLVDLGAEPLEINVSTDNYGCMNVAMQLVRMSFTKEELELLTSEVSAICKCKFATARCENVYAFTRLNFVQKTLYTPTFGVCSLAAKENISADAHRTFTDLRGCAHALLCDGMGTGRYAAVDGNLAATLSEKLMMAGFAASEAARLVNVALSLKGDTDSGATLDAITINLYTGKATMFKAGAVASFLVRQGVVTVLEGDSLPIGILGSVTGRSSTFQTEQGDTIVIVSDGALESGRDRICAMLAAAGNVPPKTLAQRIANDARTRAKHPDDITVVCMYLDKSNKV